MLPRYYREVLWDPRYDRRFQSFSASRWDEMRETIRNAKRIVLRLHRPGAKRALTGSQPHQADDIEHRRGSGIRTGIIRLEQRLCRSCERGVAWTLWT